MSPLQSHLQLTLGIGPALLAGLLTAHAQADFTLSELSDTPPLTAMAGGDFSVDLPRLGEDPSESNGGDFSAAISVSTVSVAVQPYSVELQVAVEGGNIVLTWTESGDGMTLESAATLGASTNWTPVQPTPTTRRFVTPVSPPARFFRLRQL